MGQKNDQKRICKASIVIDQGLSGYMAKLPMERFQFIKILAADLESRLLLKIPRKIVSENKKPMLDRLR